MKISYYKILGLLLFCFIAVPAFSKVIFYGSGVETVRLKYGEPTIFRFNKQVRTISQINRFEIAPADSSDPDYSVLSVNPRFTKGSSKAVFILSDGTPVNIKLVMASKKYKKSEPFYDFKPKSQLIERGDDNSNLPVVSEIELMKALMRDDQVIGFKKDSVSKWLNSHFKRVEVTLKRIYLGKEYNGFVFAITNSRRYSGIKIDVRKLKLGNPNLVVLAQIDNEKLSKRINGKSKSTTLRVVAKSSADYGDMVLPISIIKPKKSSKK